MKSKIKDLINRIFLLSEDLLFLQRLQFIQKLLKKDKVEVRSFNVLFQMPEDYFYLIVFSFVCLFFKSSKYFWVDIRTDYGWRSRWGALKFSKLFFRKWTKLYFSQGGKLGFKLYVSKSDIANTHSSQAQIIFNQIKSKADVLNIQMHGIPVGDLIYDTYLRYKPNATLDVADEFLLNLILQSFVMVERCENYFSKEKIDYYFTSYTSYLHHGIPARVACKYGTKVISAGSYDQFFKLVKGPDYCHTREFRTYKKDYDAHSDKISNADLEIAKKSLEARFSGAIDAQTYYMKQSAFHGDQSAMPVLSKSGRKKAIVFLHCFFDNPHCYGTILYPDFYEWIQSILSKAQIQKFDYYVKPHPNGLSENFAIIEKLKDKFPSIHFLEPQVSNTQLIKEGFDVGFTVYGTLAHELPYFGIPVVCAGSNPHQSFNFSKLALDKTEYEALFMDLNQVPKVPENARAEILKFYFMNNYFRYPGSMKFEDNLYVNQNLRYLYLPNKRVEFLKKSSDQRYLLDLREKIFECLQTIAID